MFCQLAKQLDDFAPSCPLVGRSPNHYAIDIKVDILTGTIMLKSQHFQEKSEGIKHFTGCQAGLVFIIFIKAGLITDCITVALYPWTEADFRDAWYHFGLVYSNQLGF